MPWRTRRWRSSPKHSRLLQQHRIQRLADSEDVRVELLDRRRQLPLAYARVRIAPTRFMKNSSRFDVKIARNLSRSSSGTRSSSASASTRRLNSSQLRSRSNQASFNIRARVLAFIVVVAYAVPGRSPACRHAGS